MHCHLWTLWATLERLTCTLRPIYTDTHATAIAQRARLVKLRSVVPFPCNNGRGAAPRSVPARCLRRCKQRDGRFTCLSASEVCGGRSPRNQGIVCAMLFIAHAILDSQLVRSSGEHATPRTELQLCEHRRAQHTRRSSYSCAKLRRAQHTRCRATVVRAQASTAHRMLSYSCASTGEHSTPRISTTVVRAQASTAPHASQLQLCEAQASTAHRTLAWWEGRDAVGAMLALYASSVTSCISTVRAKRVRQWVSRGESGTVHAALSLLHTQSMGG